MSWSRRGGHRSWRCAGHPSRKAGWRRETPRIVRPAGGRDSIPEPRGAIIPETGGGCTGVSALDSVCGVDEPADVARERQEQDDPA